MLHVSFYSHTVFCAIGGVLFCECAEVSGAVGARGEVHDPSICCRRRQRVDHPSLFRRSTEATGHDAGRPGGDARG